MNPDKILQPFFHRGEVELKFDARGWFYTYKLGTTTEYFTGPKAKDKLIKYLQKNKLVENNG